ncbi:MAG: hypothetical protein MUF71_19865 [Candidatus Kapabacteria bacterium]|jgi:hypothetical protein|nr:hypothetical protein [Candidatus Kapabacteria bacterium]
MSLLKWMGTVKALALKWLVLPVPFALMIEQQTCRIAAVSLDCGVNA